MVNKKPITILSLGGSLICPDEGPDAKFVTRFIDLIKRRVGRGERFALIVGGGKVCRRYQAAATKIRPLTLTELDWLGIKVTHLNAYFVLTALGDLAHESVIENPTQKIRLKKPVVVGAGWKPGCSTDHDAVLLAENLGAKTVINLSNIDYVYDADPRINSAAQPIKLMSWTELRKMFGTEWQPGLNSPFDPVAARRAQRLKLKVIMANGRNLKNLEKILDGDNFRGTIIQDPS
ncbi:UMP kinase [Patescibacteria group bacterium]|nr:UMP kinase [Patescibacteria group bacterium]MBU1916065.1 UMP kinase [Patescibacteria group bacterium]